MKTLSSRFTPNLLALCLAVTSLSFDGQTFAGVHKPHRANKNIEAKQKHPAVAFIEKNWKFICAGSAAALGLGTLIFAHHKKWGPFSSSGQTPDRQEQPSRQRPSANFANFDTSTLPETVKNNLAGKFANYPKVDGIDPNQIAKQLMDAIDSTAWKKTLTTFDSTKNPFQTGATKFTKSITVNIGSKCATINVGKLQELVGQTTVIVDGSIVTKEQFKKDVGESNLGIDGSAVCQVAPAIFFVEEQRVGDEAQCQLRSGNLSDVTPVIVLTTPGFTIDKPSPEQTKAFWRVQLAGAKMSGAQKVFSVNTGLGAFGGGEDKAVCMYQGLCDVLGEDNFKDMQVFLNPAKLGTTFQSVLDENPQVKTKLFGVNCDVLFQAVKMSQKGETVALINPSNSEVVSGKSDVGNTYKKQYDLGEQYIASVSTAWMTSYGIVPDLWKNPITIDEALAKRK